MFTIKQLSSLAGITSRTLRHYDEIGLLKPSRIGENGYRYYGEEPLLRLQQILFYRELGLPLDEIRKIMARCDFDALAALENHKMELEKRIERLLCLVKTVDNTISYMKGQRNMSKKQLFAAFSDEEQENLAAEAEKIYDSETVRESNRQWKAYGQEKQQAILAEGNQVYQDMIAAMPQGAASAEAQAIVERWRAHTNYFWTPNLEQMLALANGYVEDPRFRANFDAMHPGLAEFIHEAARVYVEARK